MQLWEATLINAPSMVPELLGYFPCLVEILERSFDHLKVEERFNRTSIFSSGFFFADVS